MIFTKKLTLILDRIWNSQFAIVTEKGTIVSLKCIRESVIILVSGTYIEGVSIRVNRNK